MNARALLHLLQLASPALPVGGYSYSGGLETAIELGRVRCADTAAHYLARQLADVLATWDGAVYWRLLGACRDGDDAAFRQWNARYLASRDSAELRAETVQMGFSLARLLEELGLAPPVAARETCLPAALAQAVQALGVPHDEALLAMLFSWAENAVLVCVKSVPLGQVAGQRLLLSLRPAIEDAAARARALPDEELSSWAPGLSWLSMAHEVQHGRLYRS
ncbi:urease accessory protein UreF [Massilia sp. G4R7]|uniref:Urease accessory protein UreF n=1 Tax=Massilia phyllostachyos TaxID=2898585 RepID=A0ABS8Q6Y0_9BURK|nr:urease accessory protein UreF [Massilia phyllostachyos]